MPSEMAYLMAVKMPIVTMGRSTKARAKPHLRRSVSRFFLKRTRKCVVFTICVCLSILIAI